MRPPPPQPVAGSVRTHLDASHRRPELVDTLLQALDLKLLVGLRVQFLRSSLEHLDTLFDLNGVTGRGGRERRVRRQLTKLICVAWGDKSGVKALRDRMRAPFRPNPPPPTNTGAAAQRIRAREDALG
eukprot:scaffold14476_cov120-Isochrysis_galbana.AAC.3